MSTTKTKKRVVDACFVLVPTALLTFGIYSAFQAMKWRILQERDCRLLAMYMARVDICEGNRRLFELSDEVKDPTPSGTFKAGTEVWYYPTKYHGSEKTTAAFVRVYNITMQTTGPLRGSP